MMEAAERREFNILTVWALDRVGRSTLHTLEVVEKLDALGIHFRSYTQGAIDTTSPTGKLLLTILAGVAEMPTILDENFCEKADRVFYGWTEDCLEPMDTTCGPM